MKRLAILGASGHGKVVAECAELCGWQDICFFDDRWPELQLNGHWPVVGDTHELLSGCGDFGGVLVAIGNNDIRLAKLQLLIDAGATVPTLVHPSATVSRYSALGFGSVVLAGAVVNLDCQIGQGVIINTAATVDHDCTLGAGVHVSPGAHLAGGVSVGERSWIGIGSSVRQLVRVGVDVTIGAGAAVVADTPDACTLVGVPARVL